MASDSIVDERTLREIYLTSFEMVVKEAQPKTIMSAYNLVNGTYANENAHLLMDILRRDWGFDGAVVTDWGGSNDHALGVKNGSTLEMPAPGGDAIRELMKAVQTGKITEADVDARLEELLELVFTTKAAVDAAPGKFDADAHHALARRAAAQSIVLLKNENSLLPLAKGEKVAVIGDFAQTPRYQGAGSSAVNSIKVDSFLDCLAESGLNSVGYAKGFDRQGKPDEALKAEAVLLAKNADVVHGDGLFLSVDDDRADVGREAVGARQRRYGDERDAEVVGRVAAEVHDRARADRDDDVRMVKLAHHVLDHALFGVQALGVEDDLLIGAHMLERRKVIRVRVIDDSALAGQANLVHILVELVERVILHDDLLRLQSVLTAALTRADILAAIENHAKIAPI